MYARNLSHSIASSQHNLRCVLPEKCSENIVSNYSVLRRQFSQWYQVHKLKGKMDLLLDFAKRLKKLSLAKSSPEKTMKMWAQQFEFVIAHRVRRGQQMICLYSRWWEEKALREFLKRLRINLNRNGREFIVGALGVSIYNWEERRIPDDEFQSHLQDLSYIDTLKNATICLDCSRGEASQNNIRVCKCGSKGVTNKSYEDWVPFIEKDDLMVWRRPHGTEGLFEYKVYGSYHDVTAEDFLNVQVDTNYRREWDTTAIQLEIGEQDPQEDSNSDILYWEMQWPRLFVNRDYVFNRRYKVFKESKMIVIINKTTEYPRFPKYPDKYRVEEYWSCMVIKPYQDMDKLGIEFSLTYFDNPGVNIPASITSWVAKSAMPDYLAKLRYAGRNYRHYCLHKGVSKACEVYQNEEKERREEEERNKLLYCSNEKLRLAFQEIFEEYKMKANKRIRFFKKSDMSISGSLEKTNDILQQSEEAPPQQVSNQKYNKQRNFWKYFHPLYYFS